MSREDFYERELALLEKQLANGQISKHEYLDATRELRRDLKAEIAESEWQDRFIANDYDEDYEEWGREP